MQLFAEDRQRMPNLNLQQLYGHNSTNLEAKHRKAIMGASPGRSLGPDVFTN
jgi:hypothetical protein